MKVLSTNDIQDKLMEFWRNGAEPPMNLGMGSFSNYYGLKLGTVTDITGYPYMGKTLFLKEILINSYKKHNLKHCLYLPDDGDNLEIIAGIAHKLSGKSFEDKYNNKMSENELYRFSTEILENFDIIDTSDDIEPLDFWRKSIENGCDTASIDSWNTMKHPSATGTDYLAKTLSKRNQLAQAHKKHFFTIIHPKNPTTQNYNQDGRLKPPTQFDLMGGSEWNNNGKNIIVVHKEDIESMDFDIYIRKTKPRIVGTTGMCTMHFDIPSQRFYNIDDTNQRKLFFYDNGAVDAKPLDLSKFQNTFGSDITDKLPF